MRQTQSCQLVLTGSGELNSGLGNRAGNQLGFGLDLNQYLEKVEIAQTRKHSKKLSKVRCDSRDHFNISDLPFLL